MIDDDDLLIAGSEEFRGEDYPALEGVIEDTMQPAAAGLFAMARVPTAAPIVWTDEQEVALEQIDVWQDGRSSFYSLTGPAGTGKSTCVREICERFPNALLTAMTGKAALRLAECAGRGASTLHKVMYYPPKTGEDVRFTRLRDPESSFYIVDEASMVTPAVYSDMCDWTRRGVRFLLVGDGYQLPPVITGEEARMHGDDYSVFREVPGAALSTVMRNSGGVLQAATRVRDTGEICEESIPDDNGGYEFVRDSRPAQRAVEEFLADPHDHMLITWRNAMRMNANRVIRERLGFSGPLPDPGEPVLIKKNGQGFMNGEILPAGTFETGPTIGDSLRTLWMTTSVGRILVSFDGGDRSKGGEFFDGQMPWVTDWRKYHADMKKNLWPEPLPLTWGYCLTAHSAQGSQARRVTVFLERGDIKSRFFAKPTTLPTGEQVPFSSRFVYTATTRSKYRTTMIVG